MSDEGVARFDAVVNKDGRIMIPEPTRMIHKIKHNDIVTVVIAHIVSQGKP